MPRDPAPDPAAIRVLAARVLEQAIRDLRAEPQTRAEREVRADAEAFLLDPADARLETWCALLSLDAGAVRERLRGRADAA